MILGLALVALLLLGAAWAALAWHNARSLRRAAAVLYRGDPDGFLAMVASQRWWMRRGRALDLLRLNEAVGRFWKGDFGHSLELLVQVREGRLDRLTRVAYDSCLISCLLMEGRLQDADRAYAERRSHLAASRHPLGRLITDGIEADLALYGSGDLDEAHRLCEGLLRIEGLPPIARASVLWTLAEVLHRQGADEPTAVRCADAIACAGSTFIAHRAARLRAAVEARQQAVAAPSVDDDEPPDSLEPVAVSLGAAER